MSDCAANYTPLRSECYVGKVLVIQEEPYTHDLADSGAYLGLFLSFGNGLFEEVRVVGETTAGILIFVNMVERGGYRRGKAEDIRNAKLYHAGDICYPERSPFVFISPIAENGDRVDFENYQHEIERLAQSLNPESNSA